ncbi:uncharacterized protein C8Q71DRAFT_744136 [Rhodofomes roseus]|uniref:Uncharacterized protein n=1 Tax=Rhodofomes roseus TaxID=34475 RepID=A0ABQ8KMZ7_9APHY|nr:uncharacterized protein C8Q71DRAFT_744136 [Rhodofomes roseus]KAH9839760.1 hypothetical protein C8Q71DRAFT_744136 [Rhodofomes roseus]
MTWVLGWPLYKEDALEIAKKHNLAPKLSDARRIQAAVMWIADQVGIMRAFACWVHDRPESVIVAYVDYGDNRYPPTKLARSELLTQKQFRCLKQAMPLKNFGWYQHNDPSSTLYEITTYEYDEEEEEEEDSEEDSDTSDDESSDEDSGDEQSMDAANDSDGGDATESDNETVTDGSVSFAGAPITDAAESLPRDFDEACRIVEAHP